MCEDEAGRIEEGTYPAKAVNGDIPYLLYTPACPSNSSQLPAFYFLHGYPYDETQALDLGLVEKVDHGIRSGNLPPFLVIMPQQPEPLFRSSDGGPGSYEDEFIATFVPFIDERYPTQTEGSIRAIVGISRGGVWALEIGLRHPEQFILVAAISPALAVNYPRPAYDPFLLIESGGPFPDLTLLLAGDQDWALRESVRFSEEATQVGMRNELYTLSGGHEADTWQAALDLVLERWQSLISGGD
jgi:enterochelin esterase-like enzyme